QVRLGQGTCRSQVLIARTAGAVVSFRSPPKPELFLLEASVKNSKLVLSAAIVVGTMFGACAASAADLAARPMPYAAPAPAFSWTGCYVGVHGGAGVLLDQGFQSGGRSLPEDKHGVGGLAGGQIGCNYQTGMLVLGIEGEGFWS